MEPSAAKNLTSGRFAAISSASGDGEYSEFIGNMVAEKVPLFIL